MTVGHKAKDFWRTQCTSTYTPSKSHLNKTSIISTMLYQ